MMQTIEGYVRAVDDRLPRWHSGRAEILNDLRAHLVDRVTAGEDESRVVTEMEAPERYAATIMSALELEAAPFGRRIGAFLLDLLLGVPIAIASMMMMFAVMALLMGESVQGIGGMWLDAIREMMMVNPIFVFLSVLFGFVAVSAFILSIVYFPVVEAIWGTTVGKRVLGLWVVTESGTRIGWLKAIVRRLPFYFEFFWLDAIFALFGQRRQRAFDHVAGTWVIRRRRQEA